MTTLRTSQLPKLISTIFDAQVQTIIKNTAAIQPTILPIIIIYDTYLTQNRSCCIGGYHSSFGLTSAPQSYAVFSYVDPGDFSQDVSALSHEIGEWMADPLVANTGNNTPCGILENGDPLENTANFKVASLTRSAGSLITFRTWPRCLTSERLQALQ